MLTFVRLLGRARTRQQAPWCVAEAQLALVRRWTVLASLAGLRAHACSVLELLVAASPADFSGEVLQIFSEYLIFPVGCVHWGSWQRDDLEMILVFLRFNAGEGETDDIGMT